MLSYLITFLAGIGAGCAIMIYVLAEIGASISKTSSRYEKDEYAPRDEYRENDY